MNSFLFLFMVAESHFLSKAPERRALENVYPPPQKKWSWVLSKFSSTSCFSVTWDYLYCLSWWLNRLLSGWTEICQGERPSCYHWRFLSTKPMEFASTLPRQIKVENYRGSACCYSTNMEGKNTLQEALIDFIAVGKHALLDSLL